VAALGGYELLAGTSPYRDKAGEPIASPLFSLLNRPLAADFPEGSDFDGFGIPTADIDIVKNGRLENFLVDFYIARKLGLPQTAGVWNLFVPPGDRSLDDIVAGSGLGPDFGDGDATFAGHRVKQVGPPVFLEDCRIPKLVDVPVCGTAH
jgi:predicted Zn-dependent protease